MVVGTRAQVWHGTADRTSGGLRKKDLKMVKGRIKSIKASRAAKKNKNLVKAGWTFKKGEFGAVRIDDVKVKEKGKSSKKGKRRSKARKSKARRSSRRR